MCLEVLQALFRIRLTRSRRVCPAPCSMCNTVAKRAGGISTTMMVDVSMCKDSCAWSPREVDPPLILLALLRRCQGRFKSALKLLGLGRVTSPSQASWVLFPPRSHLPCVAEHGSKLYAPVQHRLSHPLIPRVHKSPVHGSLLAYMVLNRFQIIYVRDAVGAGASSGETGQVLKQDTMEVMTKS